VIESSRCDGAKCYCQRFKIPNNITDENERAFLLRVQTDCGNPDSHITSGLIAYVEHEPVGWCSVEPRTAFKKRRTSRIPWRGQDENKDGKSVWSVTCFIVRKGYRRRRITYALTQAAVDFSRE
jgi:hypothetical protein